MERLDLEHFKICLINNHSLQDKIDGLIHESFKTIITGRISSTMTKI